MSCLLVASETVRLRVVLLFEIELAVMNLNRSSYLVMVAFFPLFLDIVDALNWNMFFSSFRILLQRRLETFKMNLKVRKMNCEERTR